MDASGHIRLERVTGQSAGVIRGWLKRPEINGWWGSQAAAEAGLSIALESASAVCRLIVIEGQCAGYVHAVDAAMWGELPDGIEPGTLDVDLFIAVPELRAKGYGQAALQLLADEVFSTTLATALSVFVTIKNEAAVRAYEKAGFRWVKVWHDPISGPSWLLTLERPRR